MQKKDLDKNTKEFEELLSCFSFKGFEEDDLEKIVKKSKDKWLKSNKIFKKKLKSKDDESGSDKKSDSGSDSDDKSGSDKSDSDDSDEKDDEEEEIKIVPLFAEKYKIEKKKNSIEKIQDPSSWTNAEVFSKKKIKGTKYITVKVEKLKNGDKNGFRIGIALDNKTKYDDDKSKFFSFTLRGDQNQINGGSWAGDSLANVGDVFGFLINSKKRKFWVYQNKKYIGYYATLPKSNYYFFLQFFYDDKAVVKFGSKPKKPKKD